MKTRKRRILPDKNSVTLDFRKISFYSRLKYCLKILFNRNLIVTYYE